MNRVYLGTALLIAMFDASYAEEQRVKPIDVQRVVEETNLQQSVNTITDYYQEVDRVMSRNTAPVANQPSASVKKTPPTVAPSTTNDKRLDQFINSLSESGEVPYNPEGMSRTRYRDPFALTQRMIDEANLNSGQKPTEFIQQAVTRLNIPDIALKGIVQTKEGTRAAMIGIGPKRTYVVRETDSVSLSEFKQDTVLFIKEINRLSVVIEVGSLGQSIILR
jgi:hypothetical protein